MAPSLCSSDEEASNTPSTTASASRLTATAFVINTAACKSAMLNARAMLAGRCMQLTLVHCMTEGHSMSTMQAFLQSLALDMASNSGVDVQTAVIIKKCDQTVAQALAEHVEVSQPGLVLIAASVSNVRNTPAVARRLSCTDLPGGASGPSAASSPPKSTSLQLPSRHTLNQPLSLRICQEISNVPVLLVKADPRSTLLAPRSIKCMMELQATSRDAMDWALSFLDPSRDRLLLAVSNAYEREGVMKATAARMLTAFSIQASTSSFKVAQRALAGDATTCLPQALVEDNVNLLLLHAPRSRYLSPQAVEIIQSAPSSVLIWPTSEKSSSTSGKVQVSCTLPKSPAYSGPLPSCSLRPSTPFPQLRPRSISCEPGLSGRGTEPILTPASKHTDSSSSGTPERRSPSTKLPTIYSIRRVPSHSQLECDAVPPTQTEAKPRPYSAH